MVQYFNVVSFSNKILTSDIWREHGGPRTLVLDISTRRYTMCTANLSTNTIHLAASWGLNKLIIVHELTHFLIPEPHAHHGALFCRLFLLFTDRFIAHNTMLRLRLAFRLSGVQF